jgi:hypothetical protein
MVTLNFDQLNNRYETYTSWIRCECVFSTEVVAGQPADEPGVRAFVIHHLKIQDPIEQEKAVQRILTEEVADVTPDLGEIPEGKLYGLRAMRKDNGWPYLGDYMVKAAIKQATSRIDIFRQVYQSKGAFAEAGRVRAWKYSLKPEQPNHIYLCAPDSDNKAETYFQQFMGRVQSPAGPVSIIHQSECAGPGTRFAWEFRYMPVNDLTQGAIEDLLAMMMIVGLGSARSMERGKFRIESADIEMMKPYRANPERDKKEKEKEKEKKEKKEKLKGVLVED